MRRVNFKHTLFATLALVIIASMFASAFVYVPQPVVQPKPEQEVNNSVAVLDNPAVDPIELSNRSIIGSWKRVELENQIVRYNTDSTAEVFYGSTKADVFKWDISKNETGQLVITETGTNGSVRKYVIVQLDDNKLQLKYLTTGKMLNYTKQ